MKYLSMSHGSVEVPKPAQMAAFVTAAAPGVECKWADDRRDADCECRLRGMGLPAGAFLERWKTINLPYKAAHASSFVRYLWEPLAGDGARIATAEIVVYGNGAVPFEAGIPNLRPKVGKGAKRSTDDYERLSRTYVRAIGYENDQVSHAPSRFRSVSLSSSLL
jgi:hypothetical protein